MVRERVEDLGRIAVMVDALLEHDLFEKTYTVRNKDFVEWFETQTKDTQEEILTDLIYGRDAISERLCEIREIARGEDVLNEPMTHET